RPRRASYHAPPRRRSPVWPGFPVRPPDPPAETGSPCSRAPAGTGFASVHPCAGRSLPARPRPGSIAGWIRSFVRGLSPEKRPLEGAYAFDDRGELEERRLRPERFVVGPRRIPAVAGIRRHVPEDARLRGKHGAVPNVHMARDSDLA